jgi:DNA-binding transcriptional ArsR family regulator
LTEPSSEPSKDHLIRDELQLKAVADPLRLRLLLAFAGRPRTIKQVAEELGERPGRLYHHVEVLERAGLVRVASTRPVRGAIERSYVGVATRFSVDQSLLMPHPTGGRPDPGTMLLIGSALADTREGLIRSFARKDRLAAHERPYLKLRRLDSTREEIEAIRAKIDELLQLIQEQAEAHEGQERPGDARRFTLTLALAPQLTEREQEEEPPSGANPEEPGGE